MLREDRRCLGNKNKYEFILYSARLALSLHKVKDENMKTSTMSLDAYKMMLVQNLVQGISRAQNYEEVRCVIQEVQFSLPDDDDEDEYIRSLNAPCDLPTYTVEELHERVRQSEEDFKNGRVHTREEVHQRMLTKFPWLR